jgi:hypothetical protein
MVTFSFFRNEFSALIFTDEATNSVIEAGFLRTAENTDGTHITYTDDDLKTDFSFTCGSESLEQYHAVKEQLTGYHSEKAEQPLFRCVTYWWETTYDMYTTRGSSPEAVTNYMLSLFNNFQIIYNNEGIGSQLNELYIQTNPDETYDTIPYEDLTQSSFAHLNVFSVDRTGFDANLATLFSAVGGEINGGGVAHLNSICDVRDSTRHSYCGGVVQPVAAFPLYSWPVYVAAHEVGHNLGSRHTNQCVWGPDSTAIDGCSEPSIGSCTAPLPSNGGTIMSTCLNVTSVGINFTNGFGPLPVDLIRDRVNSCITLMCESNDGESCEATFEPNNSQAEAATIAIGTTYTAGLSPAWDNDWYRVETSSTSNNTFSLVGPDGADYGMTIYNGDGNWVGGTYTPNSATETLTLYNQPPGTYFIQIYGDVVVESTPCYSITVASGTSCETALEPNDSQAQATTIAAGTTYTAGLYPAWDNDWYRVETFSTANNTYSLVGPAGADYDMIIYDSDGNSVGWGSGTTTSSATETVTINNQPPGTYFIIVYGYAFAESTLCYTITVTPPEVASSCQTAFEPNDSQSEAAAIAVGTTYTAGLSPGNDDYYRVETFLTANNTYTLVAPEATLCQIYVYNSSGSEIGWGLTASSVTETLIINDQPPGIYFIRIYGIVIDNSLCYSITVSSNEEEQTISVYPNPTHDMIYLSERVTGKLTNQLGQTVKVFEGSQVSLKELQPGIYLLQVEGSPNLYKIVKE